MNAESSWYCHQDLKPLGPLSLKEIRQRIERGEIGPQDLIYNDLEKEWKAAATWNFFEATLFPAGQGFDPTSGVDFDEAHWVLLRRGSDGAILQEGPFSVNEITEGILQKKWSLHQFIWKTGMSGWCQIKDRPEFAALANSKNL